MIRLFDRPLAWVVGALSLIVVLLVIRVLALENTLAQRSAEVQTRCSVDPVPAPVPAWTSASVVDTTGTLDAHQLSILNTKLTEFKASTGKLVLIVVVAHTQPEDIGDYAKRVSNTWKIGRSDLDDVVLLVVAKDDRTLAIAVGKSLQAVLPQTGAKHIIENVITPHLRRGDLMGGLRAGVDQIMLLVSRAASSVHPVAGLFVPTSVVGAIRASPLAF